MMFFFFFFVLVLFTLTASVDSNNKPEHVFARYKYSNENPPSWSKSTLYVMGIGKDVVEYLPLVQQNIAQIAGFFNSYKIFMYVSDRDVSAFEEWENFDDNVHVIKETYNSKSRTDRIAYGRNTLLKMIQKLDGKTKRKQNSLLLVLDMDEINMAPFNITVFGEVMHGLTEWDAVSFNRNHYYDIWALRYDRFDVNVWGFGSQSRILRDIIEADIVSKLDTSKPSFYPVKSAFGGVALYKLNFTKGCQYNGSNQDTFAANTIYNKARETIIEDCEHVAFHRCIGSNNGARIRIFSGILVNRVMEKTASPAATQNQIPIDSFKNLLPQ